MDKMADIPDRRVWVCPVCGQVIVRVRRTLRIHRDGRVYWVLQCPYCHQEIKR